MLKILLSSALLFAVSLAISQRTATIAADSDLKTVTDGHVITHFTLSEKLTEAELNSLTTWAVANASLMQLVVNDTQVTLSLTPAYNERNVWSKLCYQMGIDTFAVQLETGASAPMSLEQFFAYFHL